MSEKVTAIAKGLGDNDAFPCADTRGMSYREWLEGRIIAQFAVSVACGDRSTIEAAQVASDLANALLLKQALRRVPKSDRKIVCSVCDSFADTDPCPECAPTLSDEPAGGVDLATPLPEPKLCPECGKPDVQPHDYDPPGACRHSFHLPF